MPKISILVPVYQVENELRQCLDSILMQDFTDWECILVDDCSTDRSCEICREYAAKDSRFHLINHTCRMGLENVRTSGIRASNGEYVGFVDSDDWIEPNMFSVLLQNAENLSADITACSYYINYKNKQTVGHNSGKVSVYSAEEAIKQLHITDSRVAPFLWNKLFKRNVLTCYEAEKENLVGEDYNRNIRTMENCNSVVCVDIPLYHYRQRSNSSCNAGYSEARKNSLENYRNIGEYLIEKYPNIKDTVNAHYILQAMAALVSMTKNDNYDEECIVKIRCEIKQHKKLLILPGKMGFVLKISALVFLINPKLFFVLSRIRNKKKQRELC